MSYKIEIDGFKTKAEAEAFINWYSGQGEQDADIWFECRKFDGEIDVSSMNTDSKTFPIQWDEEKATAKMTITPM